jgi:hypothetical protein
VRLQEVLAHLGGGHYMISFQVYTKSRHSVKLRVSIQCMPEMQYI